MHNGMRGADSFARILTTAARSCSHASLWGWVKLPIAGRVHLLSLA